MNIVRRVLIGAGCSLWLACALAMAQEVNPPRVGETVKAARAEPSGGNVQEAAPALYYLKDKHGNLQAVPNFTLEDFEELYKLKHQLVQGEQRPQYSLQQISAGGTVNAGGYAELSIQFQILVRDAQWVRIPLRFDQAMLREPAQYHGPGEQFLHFEGEGEGYVAWIRGQTGQQLHQLTLKMLVPLASVGDETRMKLLVPRAAAAELKLKVPLAGATAKVSEGATLASTNSNHNDTEFTVFGLSGECELSWYKPGGRVAEVPAVLESVGTISARLDSRSINTEATLAVRSYGAAFDRFRVRLPPEAELVPENTTGYSVAAVEEVRQAGTRGRLVEVRLAKKTIGPVEVRLTANRAYDLNKNGDWLELAGFEVVGAARQWGSIAVTAVGDWRVLWGTGQGLRQIDQLPEPLRRKDVAAGFDYFVQPCSLPARLVPKTTRINVEPEYLVLVDSDQVRLEARLKYTIRGAKVSTLDVGLQGWQLDEVGPDNLVAVDGIPTGGSNASLAIPLLQPSAGQFEFRLRAHRPIAANAKSLSVTLPQPAASAPASAVVVVLSADNVELIPDSKATAGLIRQQAAAPLELPVRQQDPLFYRTEAAKAVFAADLRRHAQRISADVATQLNVDEQAGRAEQKLAYTIAYEPTDYLLLDVPRSLAESGRLEVRHENRPVAPVVLESNEPSPSLVRMRIALPKACIGTCELTVRYPLPAHKIPPGKRTAISIPLVMPAEIALLSNKLYVTSAAGLRVDPGAGPWLAMESSPPRGGQQTGLQLWTEKACSRAELEAQWETASESAGVVVERAWVQTWLTSSTRQDRAVFHFTSSRRELELLLPPSAALDQVVVLLDGRRVTAAITEDGSLVLPLVNEGPRGSHLLELRYHFGARSDRGGLSIGLPRLGRDAWVRRMYWQLILPSYEHVIVPPRDFTGEFEWRWNGFSWGREPLLDQSQLEGWVGVARPRVQPPATGNVYLFSTLGNVARCELRTANRSWIVLAASGVALLAGFVLIYVRRSRHPAALLGGVVVLAALGSVYPEGALLLSQAAALGLGLALVAALLASSIHRQRREVIGGDRSSIGDSAPAPASGRTPLLAGVSPGANTTEDIAPTDSPAPSQPNP